MTIGEPEADPEPILRNEGPMDWQKHHADPDLEKMSDKTLDEDEPVSPTNDRLEKKTGYQTPSTTSAATEATPTASCSAIRA